MLTRSGAGEERFLGRIKVVVLTTFDSDDYVYEAIRAGASGFLLKRAPPDTLVQGVRSVSAGDALSEFRARDFGAAVARLGAASASSAPGANSNGCVERAQLTILEECWRPAFARSLVPKMTALSQDLAEYLDEYNFDRAHTGRLTNGRVPADIVCGARKTSPGRPPVAPTQG